METSESFSHGPQINSFKSNTLLYKTNLRAVNMLYDAGSLIHLPE